jgi:hypothetical protein
MVSVQMLLIFIQRDFERFQIHSIKIVSENSQKPKENLSTKLMNSHIGDFRFRKKESFWERAFYMNESYRWLFNPETRVF